MIGHGDAHVRLLDDARQAAAAADRTVRRLLREADAQDATFAGSLQDLAESVVPVVVHTTVGRRVVGRLRAVAADHVTIEGDHGTSWIRTSAVTTVRAPDRRVQPGGGERTGARSGALTQAVRGLVERGTPTELVLDGASSLRGTIVSAGRDVLVVRHGDDDALVHLDRVAIVTSTGG